MFSVSNSASRILIVDDDASQIALIHKALAAIGQTFFEQDASAALTRALQVQPDIILLDIEMPAISGYEVYEQIKQNSMTDTIPVIFITSHNSPDEQVKCLEQGAVDFISKPLQPSILAARVKTHLTLKSRERQLTEIHRHARVTLDSIGDAVITTDPNCHITFMNPAAELMIGLPLNDALGKPIEEVMPLRIGDNGPSHINPLRLAIEERRIVGMALNCQMQCQNGRWISVKDSASPLLSESGEVLGGVIVFDDINESQAMALKMSHTLQYDQLTNLPNRFLLMDNLSNEMKKNERSRRKLGLIQLDVNRFKLINEEFGFEFGDVLLKSIAQQLKSQLNNGEMLSRHNADEFMVLTPNVQSPGDTLNLALSLKDSIQEFANLHPEIDNLSMSMGISIYPDDARDAQSLMLHADAALHRAKVEPIHEGICFYSDDMESSNIARRSSYAQIKNAISKNNVVALYQPMISCTTGQLEAVEALMRIKDHEGHLIPPVEFIAIAEETRLIIPLGEQMIHLVLAQIKDWQRQGTPVKACINISPIQFLDPHFIPFLLSAIDHYDVPPTLIELEVTESLMLQNLQQVTRDMQQLRKQGITIAIDDFGTGYSCLSYLKELPVDVLKIDRSFTNRITPVNPDEPLVKAIIQLAVGANLYCVAEGIETDYQAQRLTELGVNVLQGYLFSKPVAASEIEKEFL